MIKKGKMTKEEIKQRLKETFKDFNNFGGNICLKT